MMKVNIQTCFFFIIILSFVSVIPVTNGEEITIASGDQITLTLDDELVDCQHAILITSDKTITGNFSEIISFKGKLIELQKVESTDPNKCHLNTYYVDDNSVIDVFIRNVTLYPSKIWYVKLSYQIDDILKYDHGIWSFDYLFTSTGKSVEIVVKIPKELHQFEKIEFYDILPTPTTFYEEKSHYIFTWNSPITLFDTTANYLVKISYQKIWNLVTIGSFLIGIMFSIIISLLSTFTWNNLMRPKIEIETIPKKDNIEPTVQKINNSKRAFYHLNVINKGKTILYESEIHIKFKDEKGIDIFNIKGKWDKGPQPLIPLAIQLDNIKSNIVVQHYPYDSFIPFSEVLNIRPKIPESFCIIMKYSGENECYAFSAWSYIKGYAKGLKVDNWKLNKGKYIAEVEIKGGNLSKTEKFLINNSGNKILDIDIRKL